MMSKSIFVTTIAFLVLGVGLGYYFFRGNNDESTGTPKATSDASFFPVTTGSNDTARPNTSRQQSTERATSTSEGAAPMQQATLRQIVTQPVAGAMFTTRNNDTVVRYVARESGHISEIGVDEKVAAKVTNTTIPKIFEVAWGPEGESLVVRFFANKLNAVQTVYGKLVHEKPATTTEQRALTYVPNSVTTIGAIDGVALPASVVAVAPSPDRTNMFYLLKSGQGVIGITSKTTASASAKGQTTIFESSFSEWLPEWATAGGITLATKASAGVPGYLYLLSPTSRSFEKMLDAIPGLTARMSPDGKRILYSESSDKGLQTYLYTRGTKSSQAFPLQTLPEKCVFASKTSAVYCATPTTILPGQYPDAWYQGVVQWNDTIWKVDLESGETTLLVNPSKMRAGTQIDGIDLALDVGERHLLFRNKRDNSLWLLTL